MLARVPINLILKSRESVSCVRLSVAPWTAAHQAPLSMEFSCKVRKPTGVGCHILLQVIFSTQGPTLVLVYCRLIDSLLFEPPGRRGA